MEDSGQFAGSVAVEVGGELEAIFAVVVFGDPEAAANGGFLGVLADRVTGDVGGEGVGSRHWMEESGGGGSLDCLSGWANTRKPLARFWEVVTFWLKMVPSVVGLGSSGLMRGSARVGRGAWAAGGDHFGWSLSLNLES